MLDESNADNHSQALDPQQVANAIAYHIRAELVCCDIYEQDVNTVRADTQHAICFWGEAAARIAESIFTDASKSVDAPTEHMFIALSQATADDDTDDDMNTYDPSPRHMRSSSQP